MRVLILTIIIISFLPSFSHGQKIEAEQMTIVEEGGARPVIQLLENDCAAFYSNGTIKTLFEKDGDCCLKFRIKTSVAGAIFEISPPNLPKKEIEISNTEY